MTLRNGTVVNYNPANQQGSIKPAEGGPEVPFYRKVATTKDWIPAPGDKVQFEAAPAQKNSKGKLFQTAASSVSLTERALSQSVPNPPEQRPDRATQFGPGASYRTAAPDFRRFEYATFDGEAGLMAKNPPLNANSGLLLDKYAGYEVVRNGRFQIGKNWLDKAFLPHYRRLSLDKEYQAAFAAYYERWLKLLASRKALQSELQTAWRLAIHLGRTSVLENATIALNRTYGFPYLPGQSLKGLVRAYASLIALSEQPEVINRLFGEQKGQGTVVFFDAIPLLPPSLELDILTPHFPNWYNGRKNASDNQQPTPVAFLTVGASNQFLFAVGPTSAPNPSDLDLKDTKLALDLLRLALDELGAGAKTSAGYGQFVSLYGDY